MDEEKCGRLLEEAAAGGTEALASLYREAGRAVFTYALSIARAKALAEDITQDVFVKIRLGAAGYRPNGHACGFLLRLTRNTAYDLLRQRRHELPCEPEEAPVPMEPGAGDDDRLLLREALEHLPGTERQIVLLYLVAGVPQKEIAAALRLPVTTVNWRYRAGIKKLARILKGEDSK